MTKLASILAASTLVLTGVALYFHGETVEERARGASPDARNMPTSQTVAVPVTAPGVAAAAPQAAPPSALRTAPSRVESANSLPAQSRGPASGARRVPDGPPAEASPAMRASAEEFLLKYEDPAGRAELFKPALAQARAGLEGFDRERKLDAATFEKLVQLDAGFRLDQAAAQHRCALYPDCTAYQQDGKWDRYIESVDALIGQGGYVHARSWMQSLPVRNVVNSLSRHLPATAPLTTAQSNALIDVLEEIRGPTLHGYSENRQRHSPFTSADGMEVLYSYDVRTVNERMASARAYSRRIRDQAATVLSGPQLKAFNQMQDKALAGLWRYLVVDQAAKRAGS